MVRYRDWIQKIDMDIDYYSAFLKAWIAFNSWYRCEYRERTDREIIEKIKFQNNRFKGYIETLLDKSNNTEGATAFKANLTKLQLALSNAAIVTQERGGVCRQISFSEIAISNPKTVAEGDYRRTHYKVQRTGQKITTLVHKKMIRLTYYFNLNKNHTRTLLSMFMRISYGLVKNKKDSVNKYYKRLFLK